MLRASYSQLRTHVLSSSAEADISSTEIPRLVFFLLWSLLINHFTCTVYRVLKYISTHRNHHDGGHLYFPQWWLRASAPDSASPRLESGFHIHYLYDPDPGQISHCLWASYIMEITIIFKHPEGLRKTEDNNTCKAVSMWLVHGEPWIHISYYPDSHSTNEKSWDSQWDVTQPLWWSK